MSLAHPRLLARGSASSSWTPSAQVSMDNSHQAFKHVEDGVEDLAQGVKPGASRGFGGREVELSVVPLGIGEVALVCSSHARYPTEQTPQDPFSDSFLTEFSEVRYRKQRPSNTKNTTFGGCAIPYNLATLPPKSRQRPRTTSRRDGGH